MVEVLNDLIEKCHSEGEIKITVKKEEFVSSPIPMNTVHVVSVCSVKHNDENGPHKINIIIAMHEGRPVVFLAGVRYMFLQEDLLKDTGGSIKEIEGAPIVFNSEKPGLISLFKRVCGMVSGEVSPNTVLWTDKFL